ncbi:MAG: HlyD family efflux transporter periplasmic adaptor subunit [Hyphomicrobiales bacterium]|nr:HlyD family efflux transporter periplasmic adaptor subunit [Hyphomicrobiales bacterium]
MTRLAVIVAVGLLAACSGEGENGSLQGYVDGTYVYVSAETSGRVIERPASAGAMVAADDVLFRLDTADEAEAVAGAQARLAEGRAQLANLLSGKRPEELQVIIAELDEARASQSLAEEEYLRQLQLFEKGVVSQAAVDNARASRDASLAKVEATERQLAVARLPARTEEIEAAELNVEALEATLAQTRIALERRTLRAPSEGFIEETFYEPGERVSAGQPVVSLLPAANKKIRFFLPEPLLATVQVGARISVDCDNCQPGLVALIDFIATDAEYTPPVIYTRDNREKLVFRAEAKPLDEAISLKVGQPVDVRLIGDGDAS